MQKYAVAMMKVSNEWTVSDGNGPCWFETPTKTGDFNLLRIYNKLQIHKSDQNSQKSQTI